MASLGWRITTHRRDTHTHATPYAQPKTHAQIKKEYWRRTQEELLAVRCAPSRESGSWHCSGAAGGRPYSAQCRSADIPAPRPLAGTAVRPSVRPRLQLLNSRCSERVCLLSSFFVSENLILSGKTQGLLFFRRQGGGRRPSRRVKESSAKKENEMKESGIFYGSLQPGARWFLFGSSLLLPSAVLVGDVGASLRRK